MVQGNCETQLLGTHSSARMKNTQQHIIQQLCCKGV